MRDYGRVPTTIWNDLRDATDNAKLVALYLLTGPHANNIGAFLCPPSVISEALKWPEKPVAKALSELFAIGFAKRFRDGRHIAIKCYSVTIANPNVGKLALKQAAALPIDDPALGLVLKSLEPFRRHLGDGFEQLQERFAKRFRDCSANGSGNGSSNGLGNSEGEGEGESESEVPPLRGELNSSLNGFDEWWDLYPNKVGKQAAAKAYAKALKKKLATEAELLAGLQRYLHAKTVKDGFVKAPVNWLKDGRWQDEDTQTNTHDRPRSGAESQAFGSDAVVFGGHSHDDE